MQFFLTNASISELETTHLLAQHQVLIYGTHTLLQLRHFWNTFKTKLANKGLYQASIGGMRLRLQELQEFNPEAQKIKLKDGYKDVKGVLRHQALPFVPENICTELISRYYNNSLTSHFGIEKTWKLSARKYDWLTLCHNIEAYVKSCDVYLASKIVRYKPYDDLQSLFISTHR